MAHFRKCTLAEAVHLCRHYERAPQIQTYSNSEIDKSRTGANYNLAPDRKDQTGYIRKKLEDISHVKRKDLICMADIIITAPADLAEKDMERFFRESYDFCTERFGEKSGLNEDVCISSYVHMDETTPHMHYAFLPVIRKNGMQRFCCKQVVDRSELRSFHQDLQRHMDSRGVSCHVLNGNTRFASNGRALTVKQLKRETAIDYKHDMEREWGDIEWETERERDIEI